MQVNFGKVVNGALVRAKPYVIIGGVRWFNPKDDMYERADDGPWSPIVDVPPTTDAEHYAVPTGWEQSGGKCVRLYEIREREKPIRRWSRLSIKIALANAGILEAAEAFLSATELAPGYSAWKGLTDCDYVEEGYPDAEHWGAILDGAAAALGKTRAEIDAFLSQLPTE